MAWPDCLRCMHSQQRGNLHNAVNRPLVHGAPSCLTLSQLGLVMMATVLFRPATLGFMVGLHARACSWHPHLRICILLQHRPFWHAGIRYTVCIPCYYVDLHMGLVRGIGHSLSCHFQGTILTCCWKSIVPSWHAVHPQHMFYSPHASWGLGTAAAADRRYSADCQSQ
jgi:hypothetical protein